MNLRDEISESIPEVTKSNIDKLEKIADDYAIEFGEWMFQRDNEEYSSDELLEIYKKEKGL
jgi:hypothetical protein